MLDMPAAFIFEQALFTVTYDFVKERGNVRLLLERGDGCEEGLEIENNGS